MHIFFCKSYKKGDTEVLIKKFLNLYLEENNMVRQDPKISRRKEGKPYFENINLKFSVSHFKNFFACVFSNNEVGIDIQGQKSQGKYFKNIVKKYYTKEEREEVDLNGYEAFLDIWVKKEAYSKYLGSSLSKEIRKNPKREGVHICNLNLDNAVKCSVVTRKEEDICIKRVE